MIKKFEQIESTAELLDYCAAHGVPTDTEKILRMQDIVGHTTLDILDNIATGKRSNQFYFLLFHIWNWEQATEFYNNHSNKLYKEGREALQKVRKQQEDIKNLKEEIEVLKGDMKTDLQNLQEANAAAHEQLKRAEKAEAEVIKLKAMLFDYMTK